MLPREQGEIMRGGTSILELVKLEMRKAAGHGAVPSLSREAEALCEVMGRKLGDLQRQVRDIKRRDHDE